MENMDFLDLDHRITHLEHYNEGGNKYPEMELVGVLYPNWDCNKWEVELSYRDGKKTFAIYTGAELGEPNLYEVLRFIVSTDYPMMNIPKMMFVKNIGYDKYATFFKNNSNFYGEIEILLMSLWTSGMKINGLLRKLMGNEDFQNLKDFLYQEK